MVAGVRGNHGVIAFATRGCGLDTDSATIQRQLRGVVIVWVYVLNSHRVPTNALVIDGNWGTWGTWSNCMCNTGTHNRTRECNNPLPARGGDNCFGDQYEQESCVHQCPGAWNDWEPWSPCTVTCNGGYQLRQRLCIKPDNTLSQDCHGDPSQVLSCGTMNCQGQWASWNMWSGCTSTCDEGTQIRVRHCIFSDNITIANNCPGESIETESCRNLSCSVQSTMAILTTTPSATTIDSPGVWTEWTQWSACSTSCGSGFRYIARFCINPNTEKEKHDCVGHAVESQTCQVKQCSEATTTATSNPHVPLVPPEIFGTTEANVGGNVTLLCLTGIPGLILTWYYQENHPLPVGARHPMGTNELIITGVHSKNYGNYTCELSDSYQTVTTRVFINLRETSPAILSLIKSPDTLVEGAPVKINCNVLAFPEPVVRWGYKDRSGNSFVPPPVSYKEGGKEIDIDSFQSMLYGGTWTCSAVNKLGSDHRDITL
ncbi:hypothetical protein ACJMK2_026453 [Sinanodonta woodiana]|uniref:Ig-like domain-containing protein n=1 Tax=Sinanodonta woodiana TaxID=1069815 RepID=A0ABD3XND6_SINWO